MIRISLIVALGLALWGCQAGAGKTGQEADKFITAYTDQFVKLYYQSAQAEWRSNTHIVEGDSSNRIATQQANEALASFTGSKENIEKAREFLSKKDQLSEIQVKQLERILYAAANNPQTVPELVEKRIKAEAEQVEKLYGFNFSLRGKDISPNDMDEILRTSSDPDERLAVWTASKEVGKDLKSGLADLKELRNKTVQALGYDDYFAYQVSDYGMSTAEMMALNQRLVSELLPLYRELHTYARYELAKRYGVKEVPDMLPAHWLPNRWGQDWNAMVNVEGVDLDGALSDKPREWLMEQGERFYKSLGFGPLPASYWEKSSLYPLPEDAGYKKNNHASAWHMDLQEDVRCLMSIVPNRDMYETVHHELGHIYYFMAYTNPNVPPLLREGANRAYHEGIGSLMGLAAMQKPFLAGLELIPESAGSDDMQSLLKEALNYVVFIPWSAGVMTEFEHDLYATDLSADQYTARWWDLKKKYQGIVAPNERGPEYCDPASKTHINNDAAQYYDYALSFVLLFQLHDHIAGKILHQDPRATNYYGSKEVGTFLQGILEKGASGDWRKMLKEKTGEDLSARAMLSYFEPLMGYLKEQNKGRKYTL